MLPDALYALVAMLVRDFAEHRVTADVDPRLQAEREGFVVAMRKKATLSSFRCSNKSPQPKNGTKMCTLRMMALHRVAILL